jgi:hypothetical protein
MEKIPTAREFYDKHDSDDCVVMMIDFAKLHVEAALKAKVAAMKEVSYEDSSYSINELDSFTKHSYPLENIK